MGPSPCHSAASWQRSITVSGQDGSRIPPCSTYSHGASWQGWPGQDVFEGPVGLNGGTEGGRVEAGWGCWRFSTAIVAPFAACSQCGSPGFSGAATSQLSLYPVKVEFSPWSTFMSCVWWSHPGSCVPSRGLYAHAMGLTVPWQSWERWWDVQAWVKVLQQLECKTRSSTALWPFKLSLRDAPRSAFKLIVYGTIHCPHRNVIH